MSFWRIKETKWHIRENGTKNGTKVDLYRAKCLRRVKQARGAKTPHELLTAQAQKLTIKFYYYATIKKK